MADLNLSGQRTKVAAILPEIQQFQDEMDLRRVVWNKISPEKRRQWIIAAAGTKASPKTFANSKDPVMWLAMRLNRYFADWSVSDGDD